MSTPAGEQQFLYVYELPEELNVAHQALPTYWHDQQYDCERTADYYQSMGTLVYVLGVRRACAQHQTLLFACACAILHHQLTKFLCHALRFI